MDWKDSSNNESGFKTTTNDSGLVDSSALPIPIYEQQQHPKKSGSGRRLLFTFLSIICTAVSAILLVLAAVFIVKVVNDEKSANGVNYNKLAETDIYDDDPTWTGYECGRAFYQADLKPGQSIGRIINGFEAVNHSFPWVVSLRLKNKNQILEHFCAGSLINNDTVITAAHCVDPNEIDFKKVVAITGTNEFLNKL